MELSVSVIKGSDARIDFSSTAGRFFILRFHKSWIAKIMIDKFLETYLRFASSKARDDRPNGIYHRTYLLLSWTEGKVNVKIRTYTSTLARRWDEWWMLKHVSRCAEEIRTIKRIWRTNKMGVKYVKILTSVFFTLFHFPKFLRLRPVFQELISTATTCVVSITLEQTRGWRLEPREN